ncbi:unnamed protein product [Gongylonema pulchrum]|uniref:Mitochondrial outer membrane protein porin of 36 kDa n=1 Tax=Gongylonema pulchrum TaxID=637853 RepID=A0A183DQK6_9BILA|nr:unnamed protein product [Gongylonema pulchrum]
MDSLLGLYSRMKNNDAKKELPEAGRCCKNCTVKAKDSGLKTQEDSGLKIQKDSGQKLGNASAHISIEPHSCGPHCLDNFYEAAEECFGKYFDGVELMLTKQIIPGLQITSRMWPALDKTHFPALIGAYNFTKATRLGQYELNLSTESLVAPFWPSFRIVQNLDSRWYAAISSRNIGQLANNEAEMEYHGSVAMTKLKLTFLGATKALRAGFSVQPVKQLTLGVQGEYRWVGDATDTDNHDNPSPPQIGVPRPAFKVCARYAESDYAICADISQENGAGLTGLLRNDWRSWTVRLEERGDFSLAEPTINFFPLKRRWFGSKRIDV